MKNVIQSRLKTECLLSFLLPTLILINLVYAVAVQAGDKNKQTENHMNNRVGKTDEEWRRLLTPEQYRVTRQGGTERAFTGQYWDFKGDGKFHCVCCGRELFASDSKFDSGSGWPSFSRPSSRESVVIRPDVGHGLVREEVLCADCGAHLGHVFPDGPPPDGQRYCLNSVALRFIEARPAGGTPASKSGQTATATFGAGCFWGVEEAYRPVAGVLMTEVGYMGGSFPEPSYEDVGTGRTGHAEVVNLEYDPARVSYAQLLEIFFNIHDPTTLNRQGPDVGSQYRSVIFYHDAGQKGVAEKMLDHLRKKNPPQRAPVTEVVPAATFYRAEDYHQQYLLKNRKAKCR